MAIVRKTSSNRSWLAPRTSRKPLARDAGSLQSFKAWAWLGGILGLLGALVFFAPAAWLGYAVQRASNGRVQLVEVRGTVWTGTARLLLTGGGDSRDAALLADRVQWTLRPSFTGANMQVQALCCSPQPTLLHISPRWGGAQLNVQGLRLQLNASLLSGLGTPWNTMAPQGQLSITSDTLSVDWVEGRAQLSGAATLDMTDISSRLSTLRPLGDYRLSLAGGSAPSIQLQTLQGALQLSGNGQWVGSRLRFSGEATAAPNREEALSNLLNIIGRRSGARSLITLG